MVALLFLFPGDSPQLCPTIPRRLFTQSCIHPGDVHDKYAGNMNINPKGAGPTGTKAPTEQVWGWKGLGRGGRGSFQRGHACTIKSFIDSQHGHERTSAGAGSLEQKGERRAPANIRA